LRLLPLELLQARVDPELLHQSWQALRLKVLQLRFELRDLVCKLLLTEQRARLKLAALLVLERLRLKPQAHLRDLARKAKRLLRGEHVLKLHARKLRPKAEGLKLRLLLLLIERGRELRGRVAEGICNARREPCARLRERARAEALNLLASGREQPPLAQRFIIKLLEDRAHRSLNELIELRMHAAASSELLDALLHGAEERVLTERCLLNRVEPLLLRLREPDRPCKRVEACGAREHLHRERALTHLPGRPLHALEALYFAACQRRDERSLELRRALLELS